MLTGGGVENPYIQTPPGRRALMVGRDARHRGRRAFRPSLFWWANLLTSLDTLDPPFRRLGVGRRLIEQAIGWARE